MERDIESQLFRNLWKKNDQDDDEVIKLCQETPEGPFQKCNVYNCTVLHKAIYMKRYSLVNYLLDHHVPDPTKLYVQNDWGNTLLHNAATSDDGYQVMEKLFRMAPYMLPMRNKWGETAVFQACRHGKPDAFEFLATEMDKIISGQQEYDYLHFFRRYDGSNILHIAILTSNYDLALSIAKKYPNVTDLQSKNNEMTPLQMLACSPTAFKSRVELGYFEELLYSSIKHEEEPKGGAIQKLVSSLLGLYWIPRCIFPMLEKVKKLKETHKAAEELAMLLIESDDTWRKGTKPCGELNPWPRAAHDNKAEDDIESGTMKLKRTKKGDIPDHEEIPLILAAKHGCAEIVKGILRRFPQAMEYLNEEQQTFLHVAIRNRNRQVFDLIDPNKKRIKAQLRAIDNEGNSILHMVGFSSVGKKQQYKIENPVLQLSEDLQLLEYLKSQCPNWLINHKNSEMKTADELCAERNDRLRNNAKDWLKTTAEHSTVVIVLIATVAFASAYTVPGGPNSKTGYPLLLPNPLFLVFTVADVLSLGLALTAVVVFLSILTSSYQIKEFQRSLPQKLSLGFTLLFLSVSMMMVAFAATIILMINKKERWTKIGVYVVAFFPVCIFILSYVPLYVKLAKSLMDWALKIVKSLPKIKCNPRRS